MTAHDAYADDPWNQGDPFYAVPDTLDELFASDFQGLLDEDDDYGYEEPSGPSPEQEREWDLRDDENRGNTLT